MERLLNSSFLPPFSPPEQHPLPYFFPPLPKSLKPLKPRNDRNSSLFASVPSVSANWTLSDGNSRKNFRRNLRKKPLSDDDARRIIKERARYLSVLRRNQGSQAQASKRIRRTPEQMAQQLKDGRDGHIYGKHVVRAIKTVRGLSTRLEGSYDMRQVMSSFITKLTFREMCIVLKEQRGWRQARDFFWWMKLQVGGRFQDAEMMIHRSFEENVEPDTIAYNTFIKAMLESGKLLLAADIYDRMFSSGVPTSLQTYSTMISVYGKAGNLDKASEMFNTALSADIKVDEKAYTNMITCYGKAGRTSEAFALFNEMKKEGIRPGKISYDTMINAFAVAGVYEQAQQLFQTMQSEGYCPDTFTHLALTRAYLGGKKYLEAEEIIHVMRNKGLRPTCAYFNEIITAYSKAGLVTDAERVYVRISETGTAPDISCYRTMLRTYMENGCLDEGISFFRSIYRTVKPDIFILSAAVHLYEHAGMKHEAEEVLEFLNMHGLAFQKNLRVGRKVVQH